MNRKQFLTELSLGLAGMYVGREILLTNPTPKVKYSAVNPNAVMGKAIAQLVEIAEAKKELITVWISQTTLFLHTYGEASTVDTPFVFNTRENLWEILSYAADPNNISIMGSILNVKDIISEEKYTFYRFEQDPKPMSGLVFTYHIPCI